MGWSGALVCAVCAVVLGAVLRSKSRELSLLLSLAAGILILLAALAELAPLLARLEDLTTASGLSGEPLAAVLKAVGIALAGQLTAYFCRDAGESGLAAAVELTVRVAILAAALPLLTQILALVEEIATV